MAIPLSLSPSASLSLSLPLPLSLSLSLSLSLRFGVMNSQDSIPVSFSSRFFLSLSLSFSVSAENALALNAFLSALRTRFGSRKKYFTKQVTLGASSRIYWIRKYLGQIQIRRCVSHWDMQIPVPSPVSGAADRPILFSQNLVTQCATLCATAKIAYTAKHRGSLMFSSG